MKALLTLAAAAAVLSAIPALAADGPPPPYVTAAVAASSRPKADTDRDALRHPAELPGLRRGHAGPDAWATTCPAAAISPASSPASWARTATSMRSFRPSMSRARRPRADESRRSPPTPGYANVAVVVAPNAEIAAPQPLDVIWTSDNYHDVYNGFGADAAAAL